MNKITFKDGVVISTNEECSVVEIVDFGHNAQLELACKEVSGLIGIAGMIQLYNKSKGKQFDIINQKLSGILNGEVEIVSPYDL